MRVIPTLAAVALVATRAVCGQDTPPWSASPAVGLGPLLLRSQSPLAILRLSPTPQLPATLARGQWQVGVLTSWNNYFDVDPAGRYIIDAEAVRFAVRGGYGFTDRLEAGLEIPVAHRGGGILDRFIESFESSLGVANDERKRHPRNRFLIRFRTNDGTTTERTGDDAGWGIEDTVLSLRYQISRGTLDTPAVVVATGVKLPTAREGALFSSRGTDVAASVSAARRSGRFHLYGTATVMRYGATEIAGVELRRTQWSAFSALEYRRSPRTSYIVQALVTSGAARDFGDFSKNAYEITLGFKRLVGRNLLVEVSVLENLFIFDNSPDVGFHVGLVWRSPHPAATHSSH